MRRNHPWSPYVVGYWSFQGEQGRAVDIGPNGLHSTTASATPPVVNTDFGRTALRLQSDRYFNVPDSVHFDFDATEQWTVVATVYLDDANSDQNAAFVGWGDTVTDEWMFGVTSQNKPRVYGDGGALNATAASATIADNWHDVIATLYMDGGTQKARVFADGLQVATDSAVDRAFGQFGTQPLTIGSADSGDAARTWDGALEQLILFRGYSFTARDALAYSRNRYQLFAPRRIYIPVGAAAAGDETTIVGTAVNWAWAAQVGAVTKELTVEAATANYTWSPQVGTVALERTIAGVADSYVWSAQTGAVSLERSIEAIAESYTWSGQPGAVSLELAITGVADSYVWSAQVGAVSLDGASAIEGVAANWTWSGQDGSVALEQTITGIAANYTWSGQVGTAARAQTINGIAANYTWSPQVGTVATSGANVIEGVAAAWAWQSFQGVVTKETTLEAIAGQWRWTGQKGSVLLDGVEVVPATTAIGGGLGAKAHRKKRRRFIVDGIVREARNLAEELALVQSILEEKKLELTMAEPKRAPVIKRQIKVLEKKEDRLEDEAEALLRRHKQQQQIVAILAAIL